jgi:hypothetical protein
MQMSCGALTVASLVALGQAPVATVGAHDGAEPFALPFDAVPTEWDPAGPLAIPTIGVVPLGHEGWFDPRAPRPFPASSARPAPLTISAPATRLPSRDEPAQVPPPPTSGPPASTGAAQLTTPPASTTPTGSTAQGTTTPSTTSPGSTAPTTSTPPATTPPPATETPPPTEEPPPPVETNGRGNAVLGLGEQLTVLDEATGALALAVGVDSVSAEVTCPGPDALPPVNGHLVAVHLSVTTGSDLAAVGGAPAFGAAAFLFLGADGATLTPAATPSTESCLPDAGAFPAGPLGVDQELAGIVILDVPAIAGTLVLSTEFLPVGGEWTY